MATTTSIIINLNNFNLIPDFKEKGGSSPVRYQQVLLPEPIQKVVENKTSNTHHHLNAMKPICAYEGRVTITNFKDSKINEVIGWMLVIAALVVIMLFSLTWLSDSFDYLGVVAPMTFVVSFFIVYINWISMKFFVNT